MKKFLLFGLGLLLLQLTVLAKTFRVGYPGAPLSGVDYSDLQSAQDAASAGDTIQLYTGNWSGSLHKKLVLIGKGYFTEDAGANTGLESSTGISNLSLFLYAGSDSSTIIGIGGGDIAPYFGNIVNGVRIRRCQLSYVRFNDQICNGWEVSQSIVNTFSNYWGGGLATNLNVSNCFITVVQFQSMAAAGLNGLFSNNIFYTSSCNFQNGGFVFQSNIFVGPSIIFQSSGNCFFQNNLAEAPGLLPTGNGNVNGATMANIFVGYPSQGSYSNDARFQLKTGGPAIGAGYNGVDAGMFGGLNPYHLSGIPPIPTIYKLTAPGTVANGNPYTITVSVRSNN